MRWNWQAIWRRIVRLLQPLPQTVIDTDEDTARRKAIKKPGVLQQPQAIIDMKGFAEWLFTQGKAVERKLYEASMEPYLKSPHCFKHDVPVPLWEAAPGFYECPFCRKAELPQPVPPLSALAQAAGTEHELPAITGEFARTWNRHHKTEEP